MKKTLLLIIISLLIISCNKDKSADINFIQEMIISNTKQQFAVNNLAPNKQYFLHIYEFCDSEEHNKYEIVEFKKIENTYVADFILDSTVFMVQFNITDNKEVLADYQPIVAQVYNEDSTLKKYSYLNILSEAKKGNYLEVFNRSIQQYPDNISIYLARWQYEGMHELANRDSLTNQINELKANHYNNPDIHFVLAVAYKLLEDDVNFLNELKQLEETGSKLLNISFTSSIFNSVFNLGIQNNIDKSKYEEVFHNLIVKNPNSTFAIRNLVSPFSSKYDSLNIPILYSLLQTNKTYYNDILLKLYIILSIKYMPDSLSSANKIEQEFLKYYKNPFKLYKEGKNPLLNSLPNPSVFNEFRYHKNFNSGNYRKAIEVCREKIDFFKADNQVSLIKYEYIRIAEVYENNLQILDSAISNYIFAYERDKSKLDEALLQIYKKNYRNLDKFNSWADSTVKAIKIIQKVKKNDNVSDKFILFENGSKINLNHPEQNTVLIFYSINCGPCKWIFNSISKNITSIEDTDTKIIYLTKDKKDDIDIMAKKYKLGFDYIKNSKEIFNFYKVKSVPVAIFINTDGEIVNKVDGASKEFDIMQLINYFDA